MARAYVPWDTVKHMGLAALVRLACTLPALLLLLPGCASEDGGSKAAPDASADAESERAASCNQVPAECVTEFCSLRSCGGDSIYDEQGCLRPGCERDSDCDPADKCRPRTFNGVSCSPQDGGKCDCAFGLSINTTLLCLPAAAVTPCAECDAPALTCTKAGVPEAAAFPLTVVTATSCGGFRDLGGEKLTVQCDTQELCNALGCEKYSFDGKALSTASGLECELTSTHP